MSFLDSLLTSLEAIGRLLLVGLAGFMLARRGILGRESLTDLTRVMIDVIVPCALCTAMAKGFDHDVMTRASSLLLAPPIYIPLSALLCLGLLRVWKVGDALGDRSAAALSAIPNSFYVPYPLALDVAPPGREVEVTVLVGVGVLAVNPLQWTLGSYLIAGRADGVGDWKRSLLHAVNGPLIGIVVGALLGLYSPAAVNAARQLPEANPFLRTLFASMEMVGKAMAPMAMIILGALIGQSAVVKSLSIRRFLPIAIIRFLLVPGALALLIWNGSLPITGLACFTILLTAASPPATNLALVARRYDGDWETTSALLLATNLLAIVVLPIWMAVGLHLSR